MSEFIPNNDSGIIDIDLSITKKKRIRINQDDSKILLLNTSDMGIIGRLSDAYPKLQALQDKAGKLLSGLELSDGNDMESDIQVCKTLSDRLKEIDDEMRGTIDMIFDSNVSEMTAPDGCMYDIFEGQYRYEYIIDAISKLYEDNLQREYKKVSSEIAKYKKKYKNN